MNRGKLLYWSITVGLVGFLFGFDTAVISGAEQAIQELWSLDPGTLGAMVSAALVGTVIGALGGGVPADRYGRKRTLIWIGVLYLLSAAASALAPDVYTLMIARFVGGLGVGASSVVAPMYISEIAPAQDRGKLVAIFQFNIVFGILIAFFTNFLIGGGGDGLWRYMLGTEVIPCILYLVLILGVPRSPRWLVVKRNNDAEALEVLRRIDPATAETELAAIKASDLTPGTSTSLSEFFGGRYRLPILLAFLIAFFNQASGINAILYYAPRIFGMTGLGESSSLLASVGVGAVNLIFTLIGLSMIDRFGRKTLMYIGSVGYILSLSAVAWAFYTEAFNGLFVPICIFVFIASHAIGQGTVIWVFINEVFPNEVRSYGASWGCGTHWVFAAIIAGTFPAMATALGPVTVFAIFAGMMVLQLLWVATRMPETKGVSLEDLQKRLLRD